MGRNDWRPETREDDEELARFQRWLHDQLPVLEPLMVVADAEGDVELFRIRSTVPA